MNSSEDLEHLTAPKHISNYNRQNKKITNWMQKNKEASWNIVLWLFTGVKFHHFCLSHFFSAVYFYLLPKLLNGSLNALKPRFCPSWAWSWAWRLAKFCWLTPSRAASRLSSSAYKNKIIITQNADETYFFLPTYFFFI